ncbi:MAG: hypothetical protein C0481_15485 [Phenylobacterium sp.]|uniref:restriction endonuclease n=1 Tax=Phenylobacterium sp. TaxID=1871053 RepID=UPI003416E006|nr:hypothetical protein [Phenylobacterium sp.]
MLRVATRSEPRRAQYIIGGRFRHGDLRGSHQSRRLRTAVLRRKGYTAQRERPARRPRVSTGCTILDFDRGRDAIGRYPIGLPDNCVTGDFALEAKCYRKASGLGVDAISWLISGLRHRQFGVLVTTSYLGDQAHRAIVEDKYAIVVWARGDLAKLLISKRVISSAKDAAAWLATAYSLGDPA